MTSSKRNERPTAKKQPGVADKRKPRIMIAGEFSAGKTRLISGLVGEEVLPSNVTATALPPVWLVGGNRGFGVVDLDGKLREVSSLADVKVDETHYCIVSHPAKILNDIDIIDTPGSSDPNISAESWERMLSYADHTMWCTNATQAWRQSEKSVWDEFPEHLVGQATLLVTHADRMADERTADRVLRRVRREASKYFDHYFMASLIKSDDIEKIASHIAHLLSDGIELAGRANTLTEGFAPDQVAETEPARDAPPSGPKVTPRRIRTGKELSGGAEDNDLNSGNIFVLEAVADKTQEDRDESSVRAAWNDLTKDADMSDVTDVLACVERFLTLLEQSDSLPDGTGPFHAGNRSSDKKQTIKVIENGRSR